MKITGGIAKGLPVQVLKGNRTRPTTDRVRESLFGSLRDRVHEAVVLDLFAGSGALGLEAASRGARRVDFVEKHAGTCRNLERNTSRLPKAGVQTCMRVHQHDSLRYLKSPNLNPADLLFADPPYPFFEEKGALDQFLQAVYASAALKKEGLLIIESSSRLDLPGVEEWTCVASKKYGASRISRWTRS